MAAEWSDIMKKNKNSSNIEKRMVRQYLVLVLPGMIIFTIGLIIPLILSFPVFSDRLGWNDSGENFCGDPELHKTF